MRACLIVVALIAPLARIERAEAGGSCGGAHGGGGSAGGGGGFHHGDGAPACDDTSDVVGFRHCHPFGAWATRPHAVRLIFEGGLTVRRFDSLAGDQVGSVAHGSESFRFRVATVTRGQPHEAAALATFRAAVGLPGGLYAGVEFGVGGLVQRAATETEMMSTGTFGSPALAAQHGMIVDTLAVTGVRGALGPGTLGVELAGGLRAVSYSYQSTYHDCVQITGVTSTSAVVEARARAELWLTPWLTAGASLGTSLVERGAWMSGLFVGVHTRAFDLR